MSKKPVASVKKESTNFKLDPKLKYSAELAARVQRRNLTNYVEWALEQSFNNVHIDNKGTTLASKIYDLWDIDESGRFLKLAEQYPELLTYEEQKILKLIELNFQWFKDENINFEDLKRHAPVEAFQYEISQYENNIFTFDWLNKQLIIDDWEKIKEFAQNNEPKDFNKYTVKD